MYTCTYKYALLKYIFLTTTAAKPSLDDNLKVRHVLGPKHHYHKTKRLLPVIGVS